MRSGYFHYGDQVIIRHLSRGRLFSALPVTIVDDNPQNIRYYVTKGTRWIVPVDDTGERVSSQTHRWMLASRVWQKHDALWITTPEAAHAVVYRWGGHENERVFEGWYINLQDPLKRTPLGFDSADHELDIVITPDGEWSWKDESEFEGLVQSGTLTSAAATSVRQEGLKVIDRFKTNEWPFSEGWERWVPNVAWPTPSLPSRDRLYLGIDAE